MKTIVDEGSFKIEIYGGYNEIGGNCIVIKDGDKKIVFDNGLRFNVLKKYFRGDIRPLGARELRKVKAIPPIKALSDATAIYISHFHLDHLGLLNPLPEGVKVYVPSLEILKVIEDWYARSPSWLSQIPHSSLTEVKEITPYKQDENGVIAIPVSHSAYPAFSFIYQGSKTVFYSGDFRVKSPYEIDTILNLQSVSTNIDIALIEGTNIGNVETPISVDEFKSIINRMLIQGSLITISIDKLDFELFSFVYNTSKLLGRKIVIASPKLVDILPKWLNSFENIVVATEIGMEKPLTAPLDDISLTEEVFKDPSNYVVIQELTDFLEMLRRRQLWDENLPSDAITILTTPEPLEEESEIYESLLAKWLNLLGVQVYRVRLSGHYHPYELKEIINTLKPKRVEPIHTNHPGLMKSLVSSIQQKL